MLAVFKINHLMFAVFFCFVFLINRKIFAVFEISHITFAVFKMNHILFALYLPHYVRCSRNCDAGSFCRYKIGMLCLQF